MEPPSPHLPSLSPLLCASYSLANSPTRTQPKAFRFEDPMFEKDYGMFKAYANSKLALLMFAEELQQRLIKDKSKVIINSVNPGQLCKHAWRPCLDPQKKVTISR